MPKITNQLRLFRTINLEQVIDLLFISLEVFLQWLKPEAYLELSRLR